MSKIYTKVGDQGQTALIGGQKVKKSDVRIQAYGTVDELNSAIGWIRSVLDTELKSTEQVTDKLLNIASDLENIQHWLFDLGSLLASSPQDRERYQLPVLTNNQVQWLEERIDAATAVLKPLKEFILPSGHELSCRFHLARTLARRAERWIVQLNENVPEYTIPFINRLSDYLFTMARYSNHILGVKDVTWKKSLK